jgi:hypothetical protein
VKRGVPSFSWVASSSSVPLCRRRREGMKMREEDSKGRMNGWY